MQVSNKTKKILLRLRFIYRKIDLHLTIMRSQFSVPIRRQNPNFQPPNETTPLPCDTRREKRVAGKPHGDNFETQRKVFFFSKHNNLKGFAKKAQIIFRTEVTEVTERSFSLSPKIRPCNNRRGQVTEEVFH